jgi:hypothetical protein
VKLVSNDDFFKEAAEAQSRCESQYGFSKIRPIFNCPIHDVMKIGRKFEREMIFQFLKNVQCIENSFIWFHRFALFALSM